MMARRWRRRRRKAQGAAQILHSAAGSEGKQGPSSSSSGFTLLAHVAWPHTDSQEWQTGLFLESKAGWGSAADKWLEAGRQRRDLGLSPSPGLLSLNVLICTQGSLWVLQVPITCSWGSVGWET